MKKQFILLVLSFFFSNISSQPIPINSSYQSVIADQHFEDKTSPRQSCSKNSITNFNLSQILMDVCKIIYSKIIGTPGIFIERIEGSFYDDYLLKYIHGCVFLISGTWSKLGENPSPLDQISDLLIKEGWTQNYEYSADGPDGTTFSLRKGDDWCIVRGRWDGGDDSDTTYVPLDNYQVIVFIGKLLEK